MRSETEPKNLNYAAFPSALPLTLKGLDRSHDYTNHILRTESDLKMQY